MTAELNRHQLRKSEDWIWSRALEALRSSRRWQTAIKVILILGGAVIGAIGGGMEGPLWPKIGDGILTMKGLLVIGGGLMAFTGGVLLLFLDENLPEMLAGSRTLASTAQSYLDEREARDRQITEYEALDGHKQHRGGNRLPAWGKMVDFRFPGRG
jgi:hypothetical protein